MNHTKDRGVFDRECWIRFANELSFKFHRLDNGAPELI